MKQIRMRTDVSKKGLVDFCQSLQEVMTTREKTLVEIGTFHGDSAMIFSRYFSRVITIDPFLSGVGDITDRCDMEEQYQIFLKNTKYNSKISHLREFSYDVVYTFPDKSLDIVYIDGDHTYESTKKEIEQWLPKIQNGGILSGHDYNIKFPGVIKAVKELGKPIRLFQDWSWWVQV